MAKKDRKSRKQAAEVRRVVDRDQVQGEEEGKQTILVGPDNGNEVRIEEEMDWHLESSLGKVGLGNFPCPSICAEESEREGEWEQLMVIGTKVLQNPPIQPGEDVIEEILEMNYSK